MIKLSVIITAYNEEQHIERCIRTVLNQTLQKDNYEVIVVDDCSTDFTAAILDKFQHDIRVLKNEINLGLPASINNGIIQSNGRFYVRVDADDYVSEYFLEYLLYCIENNDKFAAVACDYIEVDANEKHLDRRSSAQAPIGCGVIFKKQVVIELGLYNSAFKAREEEELMKRFHKKGYSVLNLPLPLYRYRKHPNRITNNKILMEKYSKLLKK